MTTDKMFQELRETFKTEAAEHVHTMNQALLQAERASADQQRQELLHEAFRAAHNLKGAARTVNFAEIVKLAHEIETVLQKARDKKAVLNGAAYDVLYGSLDAVSNVLKGKNTGLDAIYQQLASIGANVPEPVVLAEPPTPPTAEESEPAQPSQGANSAVSGDDTIRVAVSKLDNLMAQAGELLISKISSEQHLADVEAIRLRLANWPRTWRDIKMLLPRMSSGTEHQLSEILFRQNEELQSLSQDVNQLHQSLKRDTLRLGIVANSVQDEVRRVRMVPFNTILLALERAVRDAARIEEKQILPLVVEGAEIELDKKVLEALKDPLLHLLRNAVSHGIENPDERAKVGKNPNGQISISVQQRGSEVHIAVTDDGRGFNLDALRERAEASGSPVAGEGASASDLIEVAFRPGISTASHLTAISGRGVGLDVVRQSINNLQGHIAVESNPGQGSSIQLVVPLSLAMTRGLLVRIGSERYVIPLMSIERIIKPRDHFTVEDQTMLLLNGKPCPLVSLAAILDRPSTEDEPVRPLAVVIQVAEQQVALLVDDVLTQLELAVKPLSKLLAQVPNVAGAALLGTGQPIIVLNTADLIGNARRASAPTLRLNGKNHSANGHHKQNGASNETAAQNGNSQHEDVDKASITILVVDDSITTRTLEKNILQAAGYKVVTATDGEVAMRLLREQAVSLVVSDVQMPNMDGITLTQRIRGHNDYTKLPVILVTSLESPEDRERGMVAGANAYIVKRGFDQAELLSRINELL